MVASANEHRSANNCLRTVHRECGVDLRVRSARLRVPASAPALRPQHLRRAAAAAFRRARRRETAPRPGQAQKQRALQRFRRKAAGRDRKEKESEYCLS